MTIGIHMKNSFTQVAQAQKLEELHCECRHWKSVFHFMADEITFIDHLINSYVFEPNTRNLFERLQDYLRRLKKVKSKKLKVVQKIIKHENHLGGLLECNDDTCDLSFYRKHNLLKAEVVDCMNDFQNLKTEIFNYASAILKKKKPKNR